MINERDKLVNYADKLGAKMARVGNLNGREVDPRPPVKFDVLFPSQSNQNNKDMINESVVGNENYASLCKSRSRSINNGVESGGEDGKGCTRKKLRLTKDQLALLESSFVQHNTLNSSMKQELAHKLNLSPRQVEVWFQNKRARFPKPQKLCP
uniref:Homeobox domain-containing protein n=1 Tax=Ananas comosus var. bracteatus TaxID=296719 RepID=A0A6V7NXW4_ANACO|nr:unnamed protein product [Ananas comosus var. bracteatus]